LETARTVRSALRALPFALFMDSLLITGGRSVVAIAQLVQFASFYVFSAIIAFVVVVLLLRFITDALQLSPFGRFAYYATRPANELLRNMRQSRFYFPLKRALGFDPAILMLLIATAILCYVAYVVVGYLTTVLLALASVLIAFGDGELFTAARHLIGMVLIGVLFYLMALMTIVFVNWLFGLLSRPAYRALERIAPLLRIFEFGGIFTGWSFLILWIALSFAAGAIQLIFLPGLRS
jgi:hypothetical protein